MITMSSGCLISIVIHITSNFSQCNFKLNFPRSIQTVSTNVTFCLSWRAAFYLPKFYKNISFSRKPLPNSNSNKDRPKSLYSIFNLLKKFILSSCSLFYIFDCKFFNYYPFRRKKVIRTDSLYQNEAQIKVLKLWCDAI